jgi:hypothetical protein
LVFEAVEDIAEDMAASEALAADTLVVALEAV